MGSFQPRLKHAGIGSLAGSIGAQPTWDRRNPPRWYPDSATPKKSNAEDHGDRAITGDVNCVAAYLGAWVKAERCDGALRLGSQLQARHLAQQAHRPGTRDLAAVSPHHRELIARK
jgi:hypothetical protein